MESNSSAKSNPDVPLQFDRIFVLFNPASTHVKRSNRRIAQLKKLYPHKVEVIMTSSEGREANQAIIRKLAKRLTSRTLLGIAAGDGTVGLVVEALTATDKNQLSDQASQAPILPLWGGNANDLAYMLNGLSFGKRLSKVFRKAQVVPIYPITCHIAHDAASSDHIAACYIAFGVSGRMAHTLNKRSYRANSVWKNLGLKVIRELIYVAQAVRLASKFSYSQSHQQHQVYELLFANGSRMAKVDRLPISLAEPYFYADHLQHSTIAAILRKLINVARGKRRERRLHKQLRFTIHDNVWAQFDGEPERVAAGSEISVRLHTKPFYALASSLRPPVSARRPSRLRILARKHKKFLKVTGLITLMVVMFHTYLSLTNPYARWHIVAQPYSTSVNNEGNIVLEKNFTLHVYDNFFAQVLGYYKSGFLIAQNTLFGSKAVPGSSADEITQNIHTIRYDPTKPYLISGDQFSVLYVRNLGVFYHSLLNPDIVQSQKDWQSRQEIYLQSAVYALDGLAQSHSIKTTMVPIGPHSVAMTAVHPGSTGSDTVYGLLYALHDLETPAASKDGHYHVQTVNATQQIIRDRHADLQTIYNRYIGLVQAGDIVKPGIDLSSARDGVNRSQSFYDSAILWKTRQLAQQLGISAETPQAIESSRQHIVSAYWSSQTGCFRDELAKPNSYSSDWLIAPVVGLVDYNRDYQLLSTCVQYIRDHKLAEPLPIQYSRSTGSEPWAVRTFAPGYGSSAIWSYWGAEYITLLAQINKIYPDSATHDEALGDIAKWDQTIVSNHGYPETLDSSGAFLQTPLYKSIRSTGWIDQLEVAKLLVKNPG